MFSPKALSTLAKQRDRNPGQPQKRASEQLEDGEMSRRPSGVVRTSQRDEQPSDEVTRAAIPKHDIPLAHEPLLGPGRPSPRRSGAVLVVVCPDGETERPSSELRPGAGRATGLTCSLCTGTSRLHSASESVAERVEAIRSRVGERGDSSSDAPDGLNRSRAARARRPDVPIRALAPWPPGRRASRRPSRSADKIQAAKCEPEEQWLS